MCKSLYLYIYLILLSFLSSLGARASFDTLFADDKLEILVAYGYYEHAQNDGYSLPLALIRVPLKRPMSPPAAYPFADMDLQHFENEFKWKGFRGPIKDEVFSAKSQRFESTFKYDGRTIRTIAHLIHWEPGLKTATLNSAFEKALGRFDVVIFTGHSISGQGFPWLGPQRLSDMPFRLQADGGWTNLDAPDFFERNDQIVVLNSCESRRYYSKSLTGHVGSVISTTDKTYFEDFAETTLAFIESLMKQRSAAETIKSMNNVAAEYYHHNHKANLFTIDGVKW